MKQLTGEQIYSLIGDLNPRLLAEALPPSLRGGAEASPKPLRARRMAAFWESGWTAAILSAIVSVAVLIAVVAAGRMGTGEPTPPGGTTPSTKNETLPETDPNVETAIHTPEQGGQGNLVTLKAPPSDTTPLAFSYEITLAGSVRRGAELSVRVRFENVSDETVAHEQISPQNFQPHVHIYRLDSQSEKQTILYMSASDVVDMLPSILLSPGDTDEQASGGQGFVYEGYTIPTDAAYGTYHMDIIANWGDTTYTATFYNIFTLRNPDGETAPEKTTTKVASLSPVHIMTYSEGGTPYLVTSLTAAEPGAELAFSTAFALYRVENGEETLIGRESLDNCILSPAPEDVRAYAIARASVSLKAMCYHTGLTSLDPGTYRLYYTGYDHNDVSVDFTVTEPVSWD